MGTRHGEVVSPHPFDVPLENILEYVSLDELTRFETEEFLKEDEKEEEERLLRLSRKPRGRPRKKLQPSFGQPLPRVLLPESPWTGQKRSRGRPRKNAAVFPSFNGPQPGQRATDAGIETSPSRHSLSSSEEESVAPRRRQYSMIKASGLAPLETSEEETSREVSMTRPQLLNLKPPAKRRKVAPRSSLHSNPSSQPLLTPKVLIYQSPYPAVPVSAQQRPSTIPTVDLTIEDSNNEEVDIVKSQSSIQIRVEGSTPIDNIDKERAALLHRFQSRERRPNTARPTSSSSSDSLMARTISAEHIEKPSAQKLLPFQGNAALSISDQPGGISGQRTSSSLQNDKKMDTASKPLTPSRRSPPSRQSITPHLPRAQPWNGHHSTPANQPPATSVNGIIQRSKPGLSPPIETRPTGIVTSSSPPQPVALIPAQQRSERSFPAITTTGQLSRVVLKPLEPTNNIDKFFRPKYEPVSNEQRDDSDTSDDLEINDEGRTSGTFTGSPRLKYTRGKCKKSSEDGDDPITNVRPFDPQPSRALTPLQYDGHQSARNNHSNPWPQKKGRGGLVKQSSPDPDRIDFISHDKMSPTSSSTYSRHNSQPAFTSGKRIEPEPEVSETDSGQEDSESILDPEQSKSDLHHDSTASGSNSRQVFQPSPARSPKLQPNPVIDLDGDIFTGAELDADTEEDSEDEDDSTSEEVLVVREN